MADGAMQLAKQVASGKKALSDLSPRAKKRVQYILDSYGQSVVKDLATYTAPEVKIGHRTTMPRKVTTR